MLLCQPAPVDFTDAPTVEHHSSTYIVFGVRRLRHRAREVNAGNHWEAANNRQLAGDGERVFVIEGRTGEIDGIIPLRQRSLIDVRQLRRITVIILKTSVDRLEEIASA